MAALLAVFAAAVPGDAAPQSAAPSATVESPATPRGFIGVGGRNAFGLSDPISPDFGVELIGGAWFLREHLQALARVGWSRGFGAGLSIDALRFAGGLAGGASLAHEHLWLGGVFEIGAVAGWAHSDQGTSSAWGATLSPSVLVLGRFLRRVLVGAQFGPEFVVPAVRFDGVNGSVQWGVARFNAGLRLGVILGPRIP